jgi:hypothetical protein
MVAGCHDAALVGVTSACAVHFRGFNFSLVWFEVMLIISKAQAIYGLAHAASKRSGTHKRHFTAWVSTAGIQIMEKCGAEENHNLCDNPGFDVLDLSGKLEKPPRVGHRLAVTVVRVDHEHAVITSVNRLVQAGALYST